MKTTEMPPPEPRRRRSRPPAPRKRGGRIFEGAIAGVLLALGVFGAVAWQRLQVADVDSAYDAFIIPPSQSAEILPPAVENTGDAADSRPVYRYSVVPGGVRSPEEIIEAMARDRVVKEHYSGVDTANLRAERLREPVQAHVSYRIGDRVYWTNRKLTLPAGEKVLTDGKTTIRERCGNNVSVDPLLPTLDNEPRPEAFDSIITPISASNQTPSDPRFSYYTPPHLTSTPLLPNPSGVPYGTPPFGAVPPGGGLPPGGGIPGTPFAGPPGGTPPGGNPPGNDPPGNPPGNPPGHPPGGTPPGGDPPGNPPEFTPKDVPDPPTPVPEPDTLLLVAVGAAALLAHRIRKRA